MWLDEWGHNPGGQHAICKAVRAFFRLFRDEIGPERWRNPFEREKPPRVPLELLELVEIETIKAMAAACEEGAFHGARDWAILLYLLDTGVRAAHE